MQHFILESKAKLYILHPHRLLMTALTVCLAPDWWPPVLLYFKYVRNLRRDFGWIWWTDPAEGHYPVDDVGVVDLKLWHRLRLPLYSEPVGNIFGIWSLIKPEVTEGCSVRGYANCAPWLGLHIQALFRSLDTPRARKLWIMATE